MFAHGSVSPQLFLVVWIFLRFLGVICCNRWVLNEDHKNYFTDCYLVNPQPIFLFLRVVSAPFLLVCFLCLKDNTFDKRKNVFLIDFESSHSISTPFCWGATFNPKFWKVGYQKKMSTWRDLKSSCHGYLPGRLTIYLVKKRLKNKIWFWGLNFKCWFWPVLTKQPINV